MFLDFWSITFGNILQILSAAVVGLVVVIGMRYDIKNLRSEMKFIEKRLGEFSEAFKQIGTILTQVAVQNQRLLMLEKNFDELRHGQGFVGSSGHTKN